MIILNSLLLHKNSRKTEKENVPLADAAPDGVSPETEMERPVWKGVFSSPEKFQQEDHDLSEREINILPFLEKICSALETITESVGKCAQKLDSEEDNDLKYN